MLSIESLNTVKACDTAVPFRPLDASGNEISSIGKDGKKEYFEILVIGGHSQKIQDFVNGKINRQRAKQAMENKFSRKKADYTRIEEDIAFGTEAIAVRIAGWSGLTEPYSEEMAIKLCESNPDIAQQVKDFSEDIANFTKG